MTEVTVIQIAPVLNQATGQYNIFGLGTDSRVYAWSATTGQWVPNWQRPAPIAQPQAPATTKTKKVAAKKKGR